MLTVQAFQQSDWPGVWSILRAVFREGESYPCPLDMPEEDAFEYWTVASKGFSKHAYVVHSNNGELAGSFYIRTDQGGLGDHVCNAGYVVAQSHRGKGIATKMCRYSQSEAVRLGYSAMRFNLVVASNAPAIRAWEKAGMKNIGTAPNAFRHKALGLVDAHIMYKWLAPSPT